MPSIYDFLTSPWKVILTLLGSGGAPLAPPGSESGAVAQGAEIAGGTICSVKPVGDQLLNVCRIGGYEMPSFIFWASLALLTLFAVASWRLRLEARLLATELDEAAAALNEAFGPERNVGERKLRALDGIMEKFPRIEPFWRRYQSTLLAGDEGKVFATRPFEQVAGRGQLFDHHLKTSFYSAVPGILTGVGLLMTFVAILDGLSNVSVSAELEIKGIGGLINGLSGKFVSSVVAVACAVAFVIVEKFAYGRLDSAYRRLALALGGRFPVRSAEYLLNDIREHLNTQSALQREFARALTELQEKSGSREKVKSS